MEYLRVRSSIVRVLKVKSPITQVAGAVRINACGWKSPIKKILRLRSPITDKRAKGTRG